MNQMSDHLPYFITFDYLNKTSKNRDKYIKKTTSTSTAVLNFKNDLKSPHITEKLNNIIGENANISYSKFDKI